MAIIPEGWGEREDKVRGTRWPRRLIDRVDTVAEQSDLDYTNTLFHLVKWALDEYDRQREKEGLPTSKPAK